MVLFKDAFINNYDFISDQFSLYAARQLNIIGSYILKRKQSKSVHLVSISWNSWSSNKKTILRVGSPKQNMHISQRF
jgi:hypothetical protein